ncbi:MAG: kinase/pyrophosphorylase [Methylococcaceae bacterium]|nr:MAG: kinase/pyrophosphorylase [Methylococcaceae bacterium]
MTQSPKRTVFLISDHTGITVQTIAKTLLSQFESVVFERVTLPFVDSPEKLRQACGRIDTQSAQSGLKPIVLSSLTDSRLRAQLRCCQGLVLDVFDAFIGALEKELSQPASRVVGRAHGAPDQAAGQRRIKALRFALRTEDGVQIEDYPRADLIVLGASRCGKTPVCLYLAMHNGLNVAQYSLNEDELAAGVLPGLLWPYRAKLCGLLVEPLQLAANREERRPGSGYASAGQCAKEIEAARALYTAEQIPFLDAKSMSVEEMAVRLLRCCKL